MAKTAKSFDEVEPISKTFKHPVEIYIQNDRIYFGFVGKFFKGVAVYDEFENKKFMCKDIIVTDVSNDTSEIKATDVVRMVVDAEQYSINDKDYVHKRYIWDSEDLVPSNHKEARISDLVKVDDTYYLCIGTFVNAYALLNLDTLEIVAASKDQIEQDEIFQHKTLWDRDIRVAE